MNIYNGLLTQSVFIFIETRWFFFNPKSKSDQVAPHYTTLFLCWTQQANTLRKNYFHDSEATISPISKASELFKPQNNW